MMKAWQRLVREQRQREEQAENLFGAWWNDLDVDIATAEVRSIDHRTAAGIIERHEWMGRMPRVCWFYFGIYFDGALGGAVVFSPEYSENLGVWDAYGYTGKMILLSRGACVHWAHPHAASKLIRGAMRLLPEKYKVVTATVDEQAGEVGTIYQACGFHYLGRMSPETRKALLVDGRIVTRRALKHYYGTYKHADILARVPNGQLVDQPSKGRYIAFRGSKKEQRCHFAAIGHLVQPYPKRECDTAI